MYSWPTFMCISHLLCCVLHSPHPSRASLNPSLHNPLASSSHLLVMYYYWDGERILSNMSLRIRVMPQHLCMTHHRASTLPPSADNTQWHFATIRSLFISISNDKEIRRSLRARWFMWPQVPREWAVTCETSVRPWARHTRYPHESVSKTLLLPCFY